MATDTAATGATVVPLRSCRRSPRRLELRVLDPGDAGELSALFERLSPASRYLRFFSPMRAVPPAMIHQMVVVDHDDRETVGAFDAGVLVGSAHYVRSVDDPTRAEIAVEVADGYHRQGVGTCLLHELADLARPRGIARFTATVLGENTAALGLLRAMGWPRVSHFDAPQFDITMTIQALSA